MRIYNIQMNARMRRKNIEIHKTALLIRARPHESEYSKHTSTQMKT